MNRRFDAIVIGAGQAGPPMAGRLAAAGQDGRADRAQAHRRHLRQHRLHADQDPGRQRLRRPPRAARRRLRRQRRARRRRLRRRHGPKGQGRRRTPARSSRAGSRAWRTARSSEATRASCRRPRVEVGGDALEAEQFLHQCRLPRGRARISRGSTRCRTLTNTTLLELDALPRHLVIVGGSYIGLEFAQMFRRFGAEVTVVEKAPRLHRPRGRGRVGCDPRDPRSRGRSRSAATPNASASRRRGADIAVGVNCASGEPEVVGSHVLLAVGRRPNTDDLGLEAAGVEIDARGYIVVDDGLRTSVPHIWALGDCNGRGAFTHTVLQRLRDRRGEPARRRDAQGQRPHSGLRALHRSAARPGRHDRGRGARQRPCACASAAGR